MNDLRKHFRALSIESLERRRLLSGNGVEQVKIAHGSEADFGEYPAMASLQSSRGHFCGGSLVAPDWIITAAHCLENMTADDFQVMVGGTDVSTNNGEILKVAEFFSHPSHYWDRDFDLSLVRLAAPSEMEPIDWVHRGELDLTAAGIEGTIIGWGRTEQGVQSSVLLEAVVPIVSQKTANSPDYYDGNVTDRMIAAGYAEGGASICKGDSGGPLLVPNTDGEWVLAGAASWVGICGAPKQPGVFARVSEFDDWINLYLGDTGVSFGKGRYAARDLVEFSVRDVNHPDGIVSATIVTNHGEKETVEFSLIDGFGSGSILASGGDITARNGTLEITEGDSITIMYEDMEGADGDPVTVKATATAVDDDHGNAARTAAPLTIGVPIEGEIELGFDRDWFSFDTQANETYQFDAVGLRTDNNILATDTFLSLVDTDGTTVLATNEHGGDLFNARVTWTAPRDDSFYIVVSGSTEDRNRIEAGPYRLDTVGTGTLPIDPFEPNDFAEQATDLGTGDQRAQALTIHESGNDDFFMWKSPADGKLTLSLQITHAFGDLNLELLTKEGVPIESSTSTSDRESISTSVQKGESYIIRVYGETATNVYTLWVNSPGDITGDGKVDHADIDQLCALLDSGTQSVRYDVDGNRVINHDDLEFLVTKVLDTNYGDANLDGVFNSTDLIRIFQAGEYEDEVENNSSWMDGDWNCDREFDTTDLVVAFQAGGYVHAAIENSTAGAAILSIATKNSNGRSAVFFGRPNVMEQKPNETPTHPKFVPLGEIHLQREIFGGFRNVMVDAQDLVLEFWNDLPFTHSEQD